METRIAKFNRHQLIYAVLAAGCSIVATLATFYFFKLGSIYIWLQYKPEMLGPPATYIATVLTLLTWVEGIRRVRCDQGLYEYMDSPFYIDWTEGGGSLTMPAARYTGIAYMMTQFFLCGPLQGMKWLHLLKSRVVTSPELAASMEALYQVILGKPTWHVVATYREHQWELRHLICMGLVEFSPRTGMVRPARELAWEALEEE